MIHNARIVSLILVAYAFMLLCHVVSLPDVASAADTTTGPATQPATQPATAPATQPADVNPPAPGFNLKGSDPKAIELADATMKAMGGRAAWDQTRYLAWNFLGGRRSHVWDKATGDIRITYTDKAEDYVILMNIHTKAGRVYVGSREISDDKKRQAFLKRGLSMWINDSYWLVMPYKLKDSGVTLKYKGPAKMTDGRAAQVITLTFKAVGDTPHNKYDVYVANDSGLVEQWAFYANARDKKPGFITPWHNWKRYGKIMLSDKRGPGRQLSGIGVFDLPYDTVLIRELLLSPPRSSFDKPNKTLLESFRTQ